MADTKVKLKLLVDKEAKIVLFAEAGKEFADFLFYLLSLPAGTIVRLLEKKNMCERKMTNEVPYVNASSNPTGKSTTVVAERGFVKAVVTYMIMDNLELKPMSTISSITMLNRFHVKDVRSLEEKVVDFGVEEGLKLLKASLECKNVLTSIFLGNNGPQE
ncbi:hypothetical protein Patl1_27075 [Pistacia atlantica]|uniref:Uncharacterized protein n=1 Tax=Pistacia atlantica TaxID=434234 RepID=A0ACC1B2Q1_9ROSI|nr:hypothetical protein Patl1_27075 [Pistacia atlantica]